MPPELCPDCGKPLEYKGTWRNDVQGTEADLAHCINPDCDQFERTRSYNERPMPPEILAARRAALLESMRKYGAAALVK